LRQHALAEAQREAAAARDLDRVLERLRQVGEQLRHLGRAAQVLLRRVLAGPRRVGQQRAVVDADARLVRLEIRGREEPHVVGRHHRHGVALGELHRGAHQRFVASAAEPRHFEVVAIIEHAQPMLEQPIRLAGLAAGQGAADVAGPAAGQRDQARSARRVEPVAREHRFAALLPLEEGARHESRQVLVAGFVHAEQRQQ
jgi:hypothetical protein